MSDIEALEEFALHLAERRPSWMTENSMYKIRIAGRRYFVIDEVDAGMLEGLRSLVPRLIEEQRKLRNNKETE